MLYDFYAKLQKEWPVKKDKKLLKELSDEQLDILMHIYCCKSMPKKERMREVIENGVDIDDTEVELLYLIRYADMPGHDEKLLIKMIIALLMRVCEVYGQREARKVSKIIFCDEKVTRLTKDDVLEEANRRSAVADPRKN